MVELMPASEAVALTGVQSLNASQVLKLTKLGPGGGHHHNRFWDGEAAQGPLRDLSPSGRRRSGCP